MLCISRATAAYRSYGSPSEESSITLHSTFMVMLVPTAPWMRIYIHTYTYIYLEYKANFNDLTKTCFKRNVSKKMGGTGFFIYFYD